MGKTSSSSTLIRQASTLAAIATVLFGALPIMISGSRSYIGQEASQELVDRLIETSPSTAFWAIAAVLGWGFIGFFLFAANALAAVRMRKVRPWVVAVWSVTLYAVFLGYFVLKYPALFEGWFDGDWFPGLIHWTARRLSPTAVAACGIILWAWLWMLLIARKRGFIYPLIGMLSAAAVTGLVLIPWQGWGEPGDKVILIGIDSLRKDKVTERIMPNLFRLINEEPHVTSFERHYVGIPRTFPSWTEILTGSYGMRNGIRHMFPLQRVKDRRFHTLSRVLGGAGYRSTVISDFAGDIFPRANYGFDDVRAPGLSLDTLIRSGIQIQSKFLLPFLMLAPEGLFGDLKTHPFYADPEELTSRGLGALDLTGNQFLTVFYSTAHFPYAAPYPYYLKFSDPRYNGRFRYQKNPGIYKGGEKLTAADREQVIALYEGALLAIDSALGRMIRELKRRGLWEGTTFVVTADHGEELFDRSARHGHGEHLYGDTVLHVPWVVKTPAGPGGGEQPRLVEHVSRSIDVAPTIAGLAGIASEFDGYNHADLIRAKTGPDPGLAAYSESGIWFSQTDGGFYQQNRLPYPGVSHLLDYGIGAGREIVIDSFYEKILITSRHRALVHGRWKIVYEPGRDMVRWSLYDVLADPGNLVDLKASEPVEFLKMQERLRETVFANEATIQDVGGYFVVP